MRIRTILFWLHLVAGVVAGVIILVMCVTGVVVAFEKEIVAWAERDIRRVVLPAADSPRMGLDELLAKAQKDFPGVRPTGLTVEADPEQAVLISVGRTNSFYANPYTGTIKAQGSPGLRTFMRVMIEWHRYLGRQGDGRPLGKAITGACTAAFVFLGVSGMILWLPRQWTRSAVRAGALFNLQLRGKARDWNWHNVIGLWCGPILIVLAATALPISYRWGTVLVYKLAGDPPPPVGAPAATSPVVVPEPPPGTTAMPLEAVVASVVGQWPSWHQITVRLSDRGAAARNPAKAQPVAVSVKAKDGSPRFAVAQLSVDPFTGTILREEKYSQYNLGRKARSWTRFLHTGEALGPAGQAVAGIASLGGAILVWTGFALAWRRFRAWGGKKTAQLDKSGLAAGRPESQEATSSLPP